MPGGETSAVSSHAPARVVPSDTVAVLLTTAVDALVGNPYVSALATQLRLDVVLSLVQALRGHGLTPVGEAAGVVGVAVLPGAGVCQLSVALQHAKEVMGGVRVKGQPPCICRM